MDKALKRHLQELRREGRAFHLSQLEKEEHHDALREAYFSVPPRFRLQPAPGRYEREPWPEHLLGIPCGATTRAGTPCKMTVLYRGGRCKLHGGMSTGAKTKAGRKRQRDGYRVWQERQKASKAGRKRTRIFTGDVPGIDGSTLAEIRTRKAGDALPSVRGIELRFMGEQLSVLLAGGHCVNVPLTTTSPNYGGVRWWYVCPVCEGRKASLYVSSTSLCCRQCAGLHYASQSK
ncbi:HGGxSTG domain-containing protein [Enterobacter chuandaensis]|uniref:HGGxSTG domain-containing protein n=1 Tax=Enterobacter chuandaensis TaxID=2497875 RepID=UPI0039C28987